MKRTSLKVTKKINAPADKVWESVANPTEIKNWSSFIVNAELRGAGVGATRTCTMAVDSFDEFIETIDHDYKIFQYSIPEPPMPIEGVLGTIQVRDLGEGKTEVEWRLNFSVAEEMETEIKEVITGVYEDGIAGLERQNAVAV